MADQTQIAEELYSFAQALVRKLKPRQRGWNEQDVEDAIQLLFLAGWQDFRDNGDLGQAVGATKDRADDLAGVAAFQAADRPVAFGGPTWRQVGDLDAVAVAADPQAAHGDGAGGGDGLDLDSEGELVGFDHGVVPRNVDSRTDVHANISQLRWGAEKGKAIWPEFLRNSEIFRRRYDN
jgi:hypothetical protein